MNLALALCASAVLPSVNDAPYASFFRLTLIQISGIAIHCYFRKAELVLALLLTLNLEKIVYNIVMDK